MGWFTSNEEKVQQQKTVFRGARRQVERTLFKLEDGIREQEKKAQALWKSAAAKLKAGDKRGARFDLEGFQATQKRILQSERKKWVMESFLENLEISQLEQDIAIAIGKMPEMPSVEGVVDSLGNIDEMNKSLKPLFQEWDRLWGASMQNTSDGIPSQDELMRDLAVETFGIPSVAKKQEMPVVAPESVRLEDISKVEKELRDIENSTD
ncbi:MAG: hypothetical protein Q4D38_07850 [Planctomycetia bacterium]|nr:hypothetical protein [Planctomycetia bacterium]